MALNKLDPPPQTWDEAFAKAQDLLKKRQLTAVAVVPEEEYAKGSYVATHLAEFAAIMGSESAVVENQRLMCPTLYKEAAAFRLMHGQMQYSRPDGPVDGWMLVVIWTANTAAKRPSEIAEGSRFSFDKDGKLNGVTRAD